MGFQRSVSIDMPTGKQNAHLVAYLTDGQVKTKIIMSSSIQNSDGCIDLDTVKGIIFGKHSNVTDILIIAISSIGLQKF